MNLLFLTVIFPFLGFVFLSCFQNILSKVFVSIIGVGSVMLSALVTIFVMVSFLYHTNYPVSNTTFFFIQSMFNWISIDDFFVSISFRLDGLSLSMLVMVTWISFLIHVYASWYMFNDNSYSLFFSYMNLFVSSMVLLILADNLLLMYFGWEGVGLCSYLLINFYYANSKNGEAALKAFIMTRIGDVFFICAMLILYKCFHTLDFYKLTLISSEEFFAHYTYLNLVTLCILIASVAKSAQLPLQTWLSNAMVAPTPVSALIHAATMVTAGVYLIARTYSLFIMTPDILYLMGIIGSFTLIMSSCSALVQSDVKKILAYSTMGQISYMFIALALQAKEEAIFHLIMHAFSKALLFLASGSLIFVCQGEQNIFKMGRGLYKFIPLIYFSFLIGGASLSAIPFITSGFYSKGDILWKVFSSGDKWLTFVCLFGSFLTSLYTFRMIFFIFHSNSNSSIFNKMKHYNSDFSHYFPLFILMVFSTVIGTWMKFSVSDELFFVYKVDDYNRWYFEFLLNIIIIFGFCVSAIYYLSSFHTLVDKVLNCMIVKFLWRYCFIGWGFDWVYKKFFIQSYLFITRLLSLDPVNIISKYIIVKINVCSEKLILSESSQLHDYIMFMIFGIVVILLILVFS